MHRSYIAGCLLALVTGSAPGAAQYLSVQDILDLPSPPPDHRITYGPDSLQFGDLRLPAGAGPHPVAVVIHGGCWLAQYDIGHLGSFLEALRRVGIATWALEYRRVGNSGGGWPGTFEDVARGADHLRTVATRFPLDLQRTIAVGHSAGGHLALWLAARPRISRGTTLHASTPIRVNAVLSLAGVGDLAIPGVQAICGKVVQRLMGGTPVDVPSRYRQASPIALLPLGVRQVLLNGAHDRTVPVDWAHGYVESAREAGDDVEFVVLEDAGHFEPIAPTSGAWPTVVRWVQRLLEDETPPEGAED